MSTPSDSTVALKQNRTLDDLEEIIGINLPQIAQAVLSRKEMAIALAEIHDRKLYKGGYGNFASYLQQRWQFSRARGYQILHFARLLRLSTVVDSFPDNERQARSLDSQGVSRPSSEADPTMRAMRYLVTAYERLPDSDRLEFVESLQKLLQEMGLELKCKTNPNRG